MEEQANDNRPTIPGRNGGTLRPFRRGESGNPSGMKKGTKHFSTIIKKLLEETINVTVNGVTFQVTRAEALMLEKFRLATNSPFDAVRLRAIMDIEDRIDGKPTSALPDGAQDGDDVYVFYIPNQHSRKRQVEDVEIEDEELLNLPENLTE